MFDHHFHLVQLPTPLEIARELIKVGYGGEICACELAEWSKQKELCNKIEGHAGKPFFEQAYGLHPMFASTAQERDFELLRDFLKNVPGATVGECGLDRRFKGYEVGGAQELALRKQVRLAIELERRITFHIVGDHRRVFKILKEEGLPSNWPLYFHRFSGDGEAVALAREYDATFGNPRKRECVPEDRIRYETDADASFCDSDTPPQKVAELLVEKLLQHAQAPHFCQKYG